MGNESPPLGGLKELARLHVMPRLLLMACSARKRADPQEPMAALERYDGVFFRVLRKWMRKRTAAPPDVLIISARFGLITGATPIPDYDQRINGLRAVELAPRVQSELRGRFRRNGYRRIFVNVGRDYLPTLAGVTELRSASWASGGIGQRARQMKQWLETSP